MSVELTDEQYLDLLLRGQKKAPRKQGRGCGAVITMALMLAMIGAFAVLTADRLGYVPPSVMGPFVGTPQVQFSARQETPRPSLPPALPSGGGGAAPWPTLTPEQPTAEPTPTQGSFWTDEELAQMTATAEAFYTVIPTAPPEFATYVDERCKDPEVVARSKLLQAFCKK